MMKHSFLVILFFNASSIFAQEVQFAPPVVDSVNPERKERPALGTLIISAKHAMIPGHCETYKRVGGLVKEYEICAFSKLASLKSWQSAFLDTEEIVSDFILTLEYKYNVGGERAAESFKQAFEKNSAMNLTDVTLFLDFIKKLEIKKGSKIEFYFGKGLNSNFWLNVRFEQGKTSSEFFSADKTFSQSLAATWLGEKPVDDTIKSTLLK